MAKKSQNMEEGQQNLEINKLASYYWSYWYNFDSDFLYKNWDMKLYTFLRYEYLLPLLQSKELYLVNILDAWGNEPYELFYFRPKYFAHNVLTPINIKEMRHRFYGQCWTKRRNSDAMWRIYAGENKDGVRICTTLGKIIQLLYPIDTSRREIPYIGFQKYLPQKDIKEWINEHAIIDFNEWHNVARESLFIKRNNFSHEDEFRIILEEAILSTDNDPIPLVDHKSISFAHISDFIQEITLSPFVNKATRRNQFKEVRSLVTSGVKVNKSILYKDDISGFKIILTND